MQKICKTGIRKKPQNKKNWTLIRASNTTTPLLDLWIWISVDQSACMDPLWGFSLAFSLPIMAFHKSTFHKSSRQISVMEWICCDCQISPNSGLGQVPLAQDGLAKTKTWWPHAFMMRSCVNTLVYDCSTASLLKAMSSTSPKDWNAARILGLPFQSWDLSQQNQCALNVMHKLPTNQQAS